MSSYFDTSLLVLVFLNTIGFFVLLYAFPSANLQEKRRHKNCANNNKKQVLIFFSSKSLSPERNDKERFRVRQLVVPPSEIELPSVVEEVSYSINQS